MRRWVAGIGLGVALVTAATASAQAVAEWPAELPPRPLAAHAVRFPPYEIRTLANGLRVVVVPHHEQPAVAMRLLVQAGAAQDPKQRAGVAYMTAQLLDQGTRARTAEQIADDIDSIGGLLGTGSGSDLTYANVVVMKDSFGVGMNLLYDVVHDPAFSQEEIDRQKERAISSLQVNSDDPDYVANLVFDRLVYGLHPYGLPATGTTETLAAITRDDLVAFHRRYFAPNNMILAVVGDVTSVDAFAMAERVFGSWPAAGELAASRPVPAAAASRRLVVIDKPDAVQTEIRVGQLAIPRKHPDYLPWDLAVKILGGEGANRLHRVLRSERGLTYGASAEVEAMKEAGDYVAETDTRTETTGEALRLMVEEFSRLQRQRVFERELADAQAYLAGSFPLTIETPNQIAAQVLNTVFYELPVEELATYRERVLAVTPDDVQRVAREYVHPDRLSIVLVGNARAFLPQLQAVGFSEYEVIPIGQLDLMSATLRRTTPRVASAAGQVSAPAAAYLPAQVNPIARTDNAAAALLRSVIEAKGGLETLRGVRTLVAAAATTLTTRPSALTSNTTTYIVYPDRFRVDAPLPDGRVVTQVYDQGRAWVRDPNGVADAPAAMRDQFASAVNRDVITVLLAAAEGRLQVATRPDADGLRVLEVSGGSVGTLRFFVDRAGVIRRQEFDETGPDGRRTRAEEVYSDYRTVSGVRVPFHSELRQDGRAVIIRTLTSMTINGPVDPALFTKPAP